MTAPRLVCTCGHGWNFHQIGNKRKYCWAVAGADLARCDCKDFREAGE